MEDPFFASVDAWIEKAKARQDLALQAIAQAALARVKELTPVKTGNLRANWTVIIGSVAQAIVDEQARDRTAESLAAVAQIRAGGVFALVNPVVYARRIEYGFTGKDASGRLYDVPGHHMLQQTITELPRIAQAAIARLNGGA